jgi:hypothetical protein
MLLVAKFAPSGLATRPTDPIVFGDVWPISEQTVVLAEGHVSLQNVCSVRLLREQPTRVSEPKNRGLDARFKSVAVLTGF